MIHRKTNNKTKPHRKQYQISHIAIIEKRSRVAFSTLKCVSALSYRLYIYKIKVKKLLTVNSKSSENNIVSSNIMQVSQNKSIYFYKKINENRIFSKWLNAHYAVYFWNVTHNMVLNILYVFLRFIIVLRRIYYTRVCGTRSTYLCLSESVNMREKDAIITPDTCPFGI